jgi:NAD(P)-dependent dehydrogenase (short-subunit alcohol dehydrogenase family)
MVMKRPNISQQPLCLVTGANTGIGFEIARGLATAGARVVLACRDQAKGQTAVHTIAREIQGDRLELLIIDLSSQKSIRAAACDFIERHPALDVLINNAGVGLPDRQQSVDGIELTFATNVLGYFLLTNLLLDGLRKAPSGRVVNVASKFAGGVDLDDVEFERRPYDATTAYKQSKQCNRMLTWALARRLDDSTVTANAMSPGAVDTRLLRTFVPGMKGRTTEEGADTAIWLANSPDVAEVTGRFWFNRHEEPCEFRNPTTEEALWKLCESMTESSASRSSANR